MLVRSPIRKPIRGVLTFPVGITPASLGASVVGWWDANDRATLFTDTGLTTPVTAAGDLVAGLADKSASGLHLTQATEANRPSWVADGSMFFVKASSHWLGNAATTGLPTSAAPCEVFALVRQDVPTSDSAFCVIFAYGSNTNTSRQLFRGVVTLNRHRARVGTGGAAVTATDTAVDFSGVHVVRANFGATAFDVQINNAVAIASTAAVPATDALSTRIGSTSAGAGSIFWGGKIAEVIVTTPLSAGTRSGIMAYLESKRGRIL